MVEFLKRYKGRSVRGCANSTRLLTAHYFGLKPDPERPGRLEKIRQWCAGKMVGTDLSVRSPRHDAISLLDDLVDAGRGVTANRTLTNLKTFFHGASNAICAKSSPVAALDAFAHETERERKLTAAELVAAWKVAAAWGYPFRLAYVQSLILLGQRRDELRELPRAELNMHGACDSARRRQPLERAVVDNSKRADEERARAPCAAQSEGRDAIQIPANDQRQRIAIHDDRRDANQRLVEGKKRFDEAMLVELRKTDPDYKLASLDTARP